VPGWEPDVLPGYWQSTIPLGADPDGEGDLVATLVRHGQPADRPVSVENAVLAVHGFTDYFFNTDLADHFARHGLAFYALDLSKCGRSQRAGQTPHFTTDLARYDGQLGRALAVIAEQTRSAKVLAYGHSAGGLIVSVWLDRLRRRSTPTGVTGLVLNSPFLDLHGPAILRTSILTAAVGALSRLQPKRVVRAPTEGGYGLTLHRDFGGEFDYNLKWKPPGGFPVTAGWLHAIRRGQTRLHRGLDVGVPNLILRSDHNVAETDDPVAMARGDAVLDVGQIARWAGCIGNRTTVVPVAGAKHDVFLSVQEPRRVAYHELATWLDRYLQAVDHTPPAPAGNR